LGHFLRLAVAATLALAAASPAAAEAPAPAAVVATYADIARAGYEDSLATAKTLSAAVDALIENPTEATLAAARAAWIAARVPYQQTEAFRFGNPLVDEWEGKVNAWPLDEGLIDYVDAASYGSESDGNPLYVANVIANPSLTVGGQAVDAGTITAELLAETLQEAEAVEANVATGYHALEFLLWGQDLNGTGPGAGNRPASDFDRGACSNGNCDRRAAYLRTATTLLVDDLAEMVEAWGPDGAARRHVVEDPARGLSAILTGMGSLSYGELAGERMKLGLLLHDPEEEHDCFSDNTFNSHYYDAVGIRNVYTGRYQRVDGSVLAGPALADLVAAKDPALNKDMLDKLDATLAAMGAMKTRGETVEAYDQMIGEGNAEGNAVVQAAIDALVAQTPVIERIVAAHGLGAIAIEGSASLDNPDAVFQ
jgi:putative iron-regulated protein